MDKEDFYQDLFQKQLDVVEMPSNQSISDWAQGLINILFPQEKNEDISSLPDILRFFEKSKFQLIHLLKSSGVCHTCQHEKVAHAFFEQLPNLYASMQTDAKALLEGDPAAKTILEVIRTYPGFFALAFFRIAHQLWLLNIPLLPRILTEFAHSKTGIDIHPGATIGDYISIDHGTGVVIGETTVIGDHVKLYQGVTLGALSVDKTLANQKRHPTIEDHVIIYSNATILGGETIIGHHTIIGGNVWITASVPAETTIYHQANTKIINA